MTNSKQLVDRARELENAIVVECLQLDPDVGWEIIKNNLDMLKEYRTLCRLLKEEVERVTGLLQDICTHPIGWTTDNDMNKCCNVCNKVLETTQ